MLSSPHLGAVGDDPGVVHQHVEAAVALDRGVDRRVERRRVGDVERRCLAADLLGRHLGRGVGVQVVHDDVAPSAARRRAIAAPRPEPAPVTKATASVHAGIVGWRAQ